MAEDFNAAGSGQRATLKEVAARAGVSVNTASVVLNPRRNQVVVHPDTRARVEAAARELGYRRNLAASRLAGGAANTFCILTDRMTNFFHAVILDASTEEATRQGFQCMLGCTEPADRHKLDYLESLGMQGLDGFVLVPVWESEAVRATMPGLLRPGVPVVFIDYRFPGHPGPVVGCDHAGGGRLLAEHLAGHGHRRVIFLREARQAHVSSVEARLSGARSVFSGEGLGLEVLAATSMEPEAAAGAVTQALAREDAPTAVMCANDHLAFSLIAGLSRAGRQILGNLAVTGFDDVNNYLPELLEFPRDLPFPWEMPLTTVRQPMHEIGRKAAELLVGMARGQVTTPADVSLPGTLVVRESTAHRV